MSRLHRISRVERRGVRLALAVALLAAVSGRHADAQAGTPTGATVRPLSYSRLALPNGLVAVFNEDHSSPIVGVAVSYHVGAKDEQTGHTGLAHLCEHMMFEGSPNVRSGEFMSIIKAGGGTSTRWASTSEDRTVYWETVPTTLLETTLWLEADRMADPFGAMDSTRLNIVRGSIRNERQANVENRVFGVAEDITIGALYPGEHPYRGAMGPMDELDRATFSEMRRFCEPYYVPNNATIAISGDFDTAKARAMVAKYFGSIKRGAPVKHPEMRAAQMTADRRIVLEDSRSRVARIRVAWSGAGFASGDKLALNALASVLQGDRTSGLTKALVYDRQLATSVFVAHFDLENGGVFQIEATPRGTTPLGAIEDVIDSMVRVARQTQPTERELRRFKNANAVTAIATLQARFMRADTLTQGDSWANDPVAYAKQVNAASRLTPSDVQSAAEKYLVPGRVVMSMVPAGKLELVSKPERKYERPQAITPGVGGGK